MSHFVLPHSATIQPDNTPNVQNECSESSEWESEIEQDEQLRGTELRTPAGAGAVSTGTPSSFRYAGVSSTNRLEPEHENSQTITGDADDNSEMNRRVNSQTKVPRTSNNNQLFTCARLRENRLRRKSHHRQLVANNGPRYEPVSVNDDDIDDEEQANRCAQVVTVRDGRFQWGCNNDQSENSQNSTSVLQINRLDIPKGTYFPRFSLNCHDSIISDSIVLSILTFTWNTRAWFVLSSSRKTHHRCGPQWQW